MSPYSENYCDLHCCLLFRNKARNAGRSRKNAGNKQKCEISRTIAGRLTPMHLHQQATDVSHCSDNGAARCSISSLLCKVNIVLETVYVISPSLGTVWAASLRMISGWHTPSRVLLMHPIHDQSCLPMLLFTSFIALLSFLFFNVAHKYTGMYLFLLSTCCLLPSLLNLTC